MRQRVAGVVGAVLVTQVAALVGGAPAPASETMAPEALEQVGVLRAQGCTEVAGIVSLPPSRVDDAVPPGYRPASFLLSSLAAFTGAPVQTVPGEGTLLMGVETCASGTLDGRRIPGPFAFGERVVEVQARDRTPGFHFYAVEQVTDRRSIARALRRAGMPVRFVPGISGAADELTGASRGGSVDIDTVTPVPVPSPLSTVSIWHESRRWSAVLRLSVLAPRSSGGVATVTARPSSPVARVMGTTTAAGIGAVNRFDLVARLLRRPAGRG